MRKVLLASVMALGIGLFVAGCEQEAPEGGGTEQPPSKEERERIEAEHEKRMEEGGLPPATDAQQPAKTAEQLAEEAAHLKERGVK